jgi:spore maturation protein CgeB
MRILCIEPGFMFSVQDVHNGWARAFKQLGHEVRTLNLADRIGFYSNAYVNTDQGMTKVCDEGEAFHNASKGIEIACYEFWPDIVFITSCFFVPQFILKVIKARGHKLVLMHTESPFEDDRQVRLAPYADINLINDPTNLRLFREYGRTEYQPHNYDPDVHRPRPSQPDLASDFCFVGTGYPSRIEFFEKVDWAGVDACFAGTWAGTDDGSPLRKFLAHDIHDCVDNSDAVDLYASTKLSANLYRIEAQRPELARGWAMGPREVELAACGVPFLRQRGGEGDEVLGFLPTFDTPADFSFQLRHWLAQPEDDLRELGQRAREAVADRTFISSARRLLTLLEQ